MLSFEALAIFYKTDSLARTKSQHCLHILHIMWHITLGLFFTNFFADANRLVNMRQSCPNYTFVELVNTLNPGCTFKFLVWNVCFCFRCIGVFHYDVISDTRLKLEKIFWYCNWWGGGMFMPYKSEKTWDLFVCLRILFSIDATQTMLFMTLLFTSKKLSERKRLRSYSRESWKSYW